MKASTARASLTVIAATVYDSANNVNWLADADLPASNRFGLPLCSGAGTQACVNASGSMRYDAAVAWVAAMNAANYLGHANWQLPTTPAIDSDCGRTGPNGQSFGFGCTRERVRDAVQRTGLKSPNTAVPVPEQHGRSVQQYPTVSVLVADGLVRPPCGNYTFSFATGWQGANTLPNFLYALPMIAGQIARHAGRHRQRASRSIPTGRPSTIR